MQWLQGRPGAAVVTCVLAAAAAAAAVAGTTSRCRAADPPGTVHCRTRTRLFTLEASDLPDNTTSLLVSNVEDLIIASNATRHALQLRTIVIQHVGSLLLRADSLRPGAATLANVTISDIATVRLQNGAVAGSWAVAAQLNLRNISALHCDGRALVAPLAAVTLTNVSMPRCRPGTFGSGIARLTLQQSHLGTAEPLCMRLRRGVGTLAVRQSRVDALLAMSVTSVTPGAASARLDRVTFTDSSVGVWQSRAVTGRVRSLLLNRTSVQTLETEAVHAAIPEVVFSEVALGTINTRALAGILRTKSLRLQAVSLRRAEAGALVLNSTVEVDGVRLSRVYVSTPCHCDMSPEVMRLSGIAGTAGASKTSPLQMAVARLIMRSAFCTLPDQPSVMVRFSEMACLGQVSTHSPVIDVNGRSHTRQVEAAPASDDQIVVFAVVLAGVAALVLTCIYCAVTRRKWIVAAVRYVTGRAPTSNRAVSAPDSSGRRARRPRYSTQSSQNSHAELLPAAKAQRQPRRPRCSTDSSQSSRTELMAEMASVARGGRAGCQPGGASAPTELASVSATMDRAALRPPEAAAAQPVLGKSGTTRRTGPATDNTAGAGLNGTCSLVPANVELVSKTGTVKKTRNRLGLAKHDNYC